MCILTKSLIGLLLSFCFLVATSRAQTPTTELGVKGLRPGMTLEEASRIMGSGGEAKKFDTFYDVKYVTTDPGLDGRPVSITLDFVPDAAGRGWVLKYVQFWYDTSRPAEATALVQRIFGILEGRYGQPTAARSGKAATSGKEEVIYCLADNVEVIASNPNFDSTKQGVAAVVFNAGFVKYQLCNGVQDAPATAAPVAPLASASVTDDEFLALLRCSALARYVDRAMQSPHASGELVSKIDAVSDAPRSRSRLLLDRLDKRRMKIGLNSATSDAMLAASTRSAGLNFPDILKLGLEYQFCDGRQMWP